MNKAFANGNVRYFLMLIKLNEPFPSEKKAVIIYSRRYVKNNRNCNQISDNFHTRTQLLVVKNEQKTRNGHEVYAINAVNK